MSWLYFLEIRMNKIFFILSLVFTGGCQTSDKKATSKNTQTEKPISPDTLQLISQQQICKKCDTTIITIVANRGIGSQNSLIETFLCSFDKTCNWKIKYNGELGTYDQLAYEMLVVQLDRHLNICIELFDRNKNINFSYILSLLKEMPVLDLPYSSIISQLEKRTSRNLTEQKLLDTLKQADTELKQRIQKKTK